MMVDNEMGLWREQWQSAAAVPIDLRKRVERQTRAMKLMLIGDCLVTLVIGGGAIVWAALSRDADVLLLAIATWIFIAAAWAAGVAFNRGKWSPSAESAAVFLDLSVRRCRSRLAASVFGGVLFVAELTFSLAWIYGHTVEQLPVSKWLLFSSAAIDCVWIFTVLFFVALFLYRSRKQAELKQLTAMLDVQASERRSLASNRA